MGKLFEAIGNIFRIPDLRKRVLFTFLMLAVYRFGSFVPTPGIDVIRWQDFLNTQSGGVLGFFDLFAGGNVRRMSIFALGIMPYITASIILQLLTVVVPTLEKLQKEGELGRRKITQWTRYLTIALGIAQSFGIAMSLQSVSGNIVINPGVGFVLLDDPARCTTGTAFHHVAGRADHRTRRGQRHVADHLHRDCGGRARSHRQPLHQRIHNP